MGILLFNPSLKDHAGTLNSNLGDLIITEAVTNEVKRLFPDEEIASIASHAYPDEAERSKIKKARHRIVGGTNVLSSDMRHCRQWRFSARTMAFHPALLCGVGWQHYQEPVTIYTRLLLQVILSRFGLHSVRDGYTKKKLASCGVWNVVNTSCPTLWRLAGPRKVVNEQKPAQSVLFMLTDYRKDEKSDRQLASILAAEYETLYFWPQGEMDLGYLAELLPPKKPNLVVLDRTLEALDRCLATTPDLDYVGTRLHGGIRCLHAGKRSLILEVDNRAREIAKETGLPSLPRTEIDNIKKWVKSGWKCEIHIDEQPIQRWRAQFAKPQPATP